MEKLSGEEMNTLKSYLIEKTDQGQGKTSDLLLRK